MFPNVEPGIGVIIRGLDKATSSSERTVQGICNEEQRQWEKVISNVRFIGDLWKAACIQTKMFILKRVYDYNKLCTQFLKPLQNTLKKAMRIYLIMSMLYNRSAKQRVSISSPLKTYLQDLGGLCHKKWITEIY
jgi:hypothetical protein